MMSTSHRKPPLLRHDQDNSPSSESCPETPPHDLLHPPLHLPTMSLAAVAVAASLLLAFLVAIIRRSRLRQRATSPGAPDLFSVHIDSLREDDRGRIDHHIWLINTIGLDRSVVASITVCEFKKGDGLIDGTECTICLGEFEEGEDLRLLPKCSHAFHVHCIDTWLRAHRNCPLCRAPIVRDMEASCGGMNLEEPRLNMGALERSLTIESGGAEGCNRGEGGFRGENEARNEKGIRPSVMEICRTSVFDNTSRFAKVKSGHHAVCSSKTSESSRNRIRRSSSDAGILSLQRSSKPTAMFLDFH
ncbi:hypothetical protein MLD38_028492 [Melastoma candidum]|uniref:Uncharacterized protein n=1 Tax=Melastoma candidum TaxID=119954 RepID=A0ACB9N3D8_9MYRT|nr:hypothetical protein MLD38_028492 [Melastoma candidum]